MFGVVGFLSLWIAATEVTSSDINVTQLGVASVAVGIAVFGWRNEAKRTDKMLVTHEVLVEIRDAMRANADAHSRSAAAQESATVALRAATEAIGRMQASTLSSSDVTRITAALDRNERLAQRQDRDGR